MERQSLLALAILLVTFTTIPAFSQMLYFNNFEDPSDPLIEWSNTLTDSTPGTAEHTADRFLGQFVNDTVRFTMTDLRSHTHITLSFDLFIIRTWDGNSSTYGPDVWDLSVPGGPTLLHTTFSNTDFEPFNNRQAYPGEYPGGNYPGCTGAAEIKTLGYYVDHPSLGRIKVDSVYTLTFTFPHSANSLLLSFSGTGLQDTGESWGLNNIEIVPEPATLSLLGLGCLALRRRRRA